MYIKKLIKKILKENYDVVDKDEFKDTLLDLTTLDLEDEQVGYPKTEGRKMYSLFSIGNNYLYLMDKKTLPSSGPFEIIIENFDDEIIGYLRGTKSNMIISFNMVHIKEDYRGYGIGTEIYETLLNKGYIIKSDDEITDSTYSLYDKLVSLYGFKPLVFNDGTVGLKK